MSALGSISNKGTGVSKSGRKWLAPFVWVGLWLASVTTATGLVSSVVWMLRTKSIPSRTEIDGWLWRSRETKVAALREAYNGRRSAVPDLQQAEIQAFLNTITKASEGDDNSLWKKSMDVDRFRARFNRSPWVRTLSIIDRRIAARRKIDELSIDAPNRYERIDIVRVVPWEQSSAAATADRGEILVFTFGYRPYSEGEPVLFWLRKVGESWKLVDWEWGDLGTSESESAGLWESASHDKRFVNFQNANQLLNDIDQLDYSKMALAERQLKQVEASDVPPQMRDVLTYMLMSRWSHRSRSEDVRRLANQVSAPDLIPGTYMVRASACEELGESNEALAAMERVEELIGFRPELAKKRAKLLQRAGRRDDAVSEWRRVADFESDDVSVLTELQTLLPKSQRSEVLDRIRSAREPAKLAWQFASQNRYRLSPATLQEFRSFVKEIAPDSNEAREVEIMQLSQSNQHLAAAALYRRAIDEKPDPDERNRLWLGYLREMQKGDALVAGFLEHPDPRAAFQMLVQGVDEGEGMASVEELAPLLEAYRKIGPDDLWLLYYEGYFAAEKQHFAEADEKFAETEKQLAEKQKGSPDAAEVDASSAAKEDSDDLESLAIQLRTQRCRMRYELGEDVAILKDYQSDETCYQTLAGSANQYRHWKVLDRLNQSYEASTSKRIWLPYHQAEVLLAMRDFNGVRSKLLNMTNHEAEAPWMIHYRKQVEQELLAAEFPNPLHAFRNGKDRTDSFNRISQELLADRDWVTLDRLIHEYNVDADDPSVAFVQLDKVWRQADDEALVNRLTPWPTALLSKQKYLEFAWRERFVRSLLRLGRTDEAREKATEFDRRFDEKWPLMMCDVVQQRAKEIAQRLEDDEQLETTWKTRDFAADPYLRPVLWDDAFADLRANYLIAFPHYAEFDSLVLLLGMPIELTEPVLMERLSEPDAAAESKPRITSVLPSKFVVEWRGVRFVVSSTSEPYFSQQYLAEPGFTRRRRDRTAEMNALFDEQRAFLRIAILSSDAGGPWNSPTTTIREFGARLLDTNVIGAVNRVQFLPVAQMIRLNEKQAERLASRRSFAELDPDTIGVRVPARENLVDQIVKKSLVKLVGTQLSQDSPIIAKVKLGPAEFDLIVPFRVHEVRSARFSGHELIGEYAGDEHFAGFPELRRGVRFTISLDDVVSFDQTSQ